MGKKWSEMTSAQKIKFLLLLLYVVIGLVLGMLDVVGTWKNNVYYYMVVVYFLVEGTVQCKKNWKQALLDFAVSVVFLIQIFTR